MKTFAVILNLLAILLNIIVLTIACGLWLQSLDLFSYGIISWFSEELMFLLFISIFPIVNLMVLLNKYSMTDKWLVRFFNWNMSKIQLLCMWVGLAAILYVGFFIVKYVERYFVWGFWSWRYKGFAFRTSLVAIVICGLIITFKNKKRKDEQNQ